MDKLRKSLTQGTRGTTTLGKWVDQKGVVHDLSSGKDDEWFDKVRQVSATFPPNQRAAVRLARHLEVKFAVRMREQGLREETIVIDRPVCGLGPTDSTLPFTCDKLLPRFLPPGAQLTVVEHDGTRRTYRGEASP